MGQVTKADAECLIESMRVAYVPLPSQLKFHKSQARFKGFSGPIGSGKSQALCQEALRMAVANPNRTGLIGAPTYPMLRDSTQASLFETLAESELRWEYNKAENQLLLKDIGSKIIFRSLDDYERLRGTNLAWFGVDELTYTSEDAWLRLEGRLRDPKAKKLCGFGVWTPKGFDWVYRRFIQNPPEGYEVVQARPFENKHLLGSVPDFYLRLQGSYDAAFFAQEVMGAYVNPQRGRVYEAFERTQNVLEHERDEELPLRWALDFNVDPMSSVVAQISDGKVEVLDEIVLSRASTEDACREFVKRYPKWKHGLVVYADASGRHLQTAGSSDEQVIRSFFGKAREGAVSVKIPTRNPAVKARVQLVNAKLRSADGTVGLTITPRCKELIKDFDEVTWVEGTHEIDKAKDKKRTHLSDALGYLLWAEFHSKPKIGPMKNGFKPSRSIA